MYIEDFIGPILLFLGGPMIIVLGSFVTYMMAITLSALCVIYTDQWKHWIERKSVRKIIN